MAHINLPEGIPGISSLFSAYPETAIPLRALAHALLKGPSPLTEGERELIATYVSYLNECFFCATSHGQAAKHLMGNNSEIIEAVKKDYRSAPIGDKLKSLLNIASKVQKEARRVTLTDVEEARKHGATDKDIHDTVLIAAAFCMYNRYVDGLDTWQPGDPDLYDQMGKVMAEQGYVREKK